MGARVAILGAGYISDFHIRALKAIGELDVVAICDNDERKATSTAVRWRIGNSYRSVEAMLAAGGIDVVHVLVPPLYHAAASVSCLEAGCDLFIEKPLATSRADCLEIQRAADRKGRLVGVNHNATFHPAFRRLIKAIQEGQLGGVQHVTACMNVPLRQLAAGQHSHWMFQRPGNIILEQAPHPLSQIQFLLGNFQSLSSVPSGPVRLNSGNLFFENWQISGIAERGTAQCFLSFGREYLEWSLHVIGQDGSAFVDLRRNIVVFSGKTRFMEPVENFLLAWGGAWQQLGQGSRNLADYCLGFVNLRPAGDPFYRSMSGGIRAFYEARSRRQSPPVTLESAAAVIKACEAIAQPALEQAELEMNKCERVTL